jgi:hypothetical protein
VRLLNASLSVVVDESMCGDVSEEEYVCTGIVISICMYACGSYKTVNNIFLSMNTDVFLCSHSHTRTYIFHHTATSAQPK